MAFVHLHNHSQYSLLDATLSLTNMVERAKAYGMQAVALTDHGNLFGAVEFYKFMKGAKIKPIIGMELYLSPGKMSEKKKQASLPNAFHLTLLAKNSVGYHNLMKLSSLGYLEGFYYTPRVDFETLVANKEGLICLSGCIESPFAYHIVRSNEAGAEDLLLEYKKIFGEDFYLELQRHTQNTEDIEIDGYHEESWTYQNYQDYIVKQTKVNQALLTFSQKHNIKTVATNNCHFLERNDWRAHEICINIQSGEPCEVWEGDHKRPNPKRSTFPSHELYFKRQDEMIELFKDIPEAISTTIEIAEKCTFEMDLSTKRYPIYIPPDLADKSYTVKEREESVSQYLRKLSEDAIPVRYTPYKLKRVQEKYPNQDPFEIIKKRLDYELGIISQKGMCDYLLIVWDFIHWAKNQGIPMGPGRGSGAGSIICYLTGITDIEPLCFSLFFERFINPERLSYPDIDVDICMKRRDEVIKYTIQKYGKESVAQIITFGTMKAKMAIRDVGRILNVPLSKVNSIVKLVPDDLNITIEKALEQEPSLQELCANDHETQTLIDIARKLEGCLRNSSTHAAGLIISATPLIEHIPICVAKDSDMNVTQYSMKPVEMVGMLKIDFLGLKTLTCLQICEDSINSKGIVNVDWTDLPLEDIKTFNLLNQGKTQGIFQLESAGMQDLAKQLHLDKFEEIIAVISLYRPGPMDMIPSYIARKHKREPIEYDHPWMEPILSETYGIMVYQEQVMQIASSLANYSLGEGDVLRRAMGKKDTAEMAKQREKFQHGALKNEINIDVANHVFDKMEKFAEYGFNKSHAAAYGYLTYATAYMKAHFPMEWLSALMTCDRDDTSKIAKFTQEGNSMGISILTPDINESFAYFVATPSGIRFAMTGIKGIGEMPCSIIVQEREKNGPYKNLYDFVRRTYPQKIGKKVVELLIDAGCFSITSWSRDEMITSLDAMISSAERSHKEELSGTLSLFGPSHIHEEAQFLKPPKLTFQRNKEELLLREKELLGFFLTGHPLDFFQGKEKELNCQNFSSYTDVPEGKPVLFRTALFIEDVKIRISSKSQKKFAILTVSERSGLVHELPVWSDLYEEKQSHIVKDNVMLALIQKERKDGDVVSTCRWLCDFKKTSEKEMKELDLAYDKAKSFIARSEHHQKGKNPNKEKSQKPMKEEKKEKVVLSFDIDKLRASHILQLQTALSSKDGAPVEVTFLSDNKTVTTLAINTNKRKVQFNKALEAKLKEIPSYLSGSIVSD